MCSNFSVIASFVGIIICSIISILRHFLDLFFFKISSDNVPTLNKYWQSKGHLTGSNSVPVRDGAVSIIYDSVMRFVESYITQL
jgi:hypothetical protein